MNREDEPGIKWDLGAVQRDRLRHAQPGVTPRMSFSQLLEAAMSGHGLPQEPPAIPEEWVKYRTDSNGFTFANLKANLGRHLNEAERAGQTVSSFVMPTLGSLKSGIGLAGKAISSMFSEDPDPPIKRGGRGGAVLAPGSPVSLVRGHKVDDGRGL